MLPRLPRFLPLLLLLGCLAPDPVDDPDVSSPEGPRFSLGQWSFHRELFAGEMSTEEFIETAAELDFDGVELVNQFFDDRATDADYLDGLRATAAEQEVALTMLLIDGAGKLGAAEATERDRAVSRHLQWLDATARLGIPAMRINAEGDGNPEAMLEACVAGIGRVAAEARERGISLLIENHGGPSSNADWLAELVGRLAEYGVGTVADFDNWCYRRSDGSTYGGECTARFDRYQGMQTLLPYAGGISVKAFDFTSDGEEAGMDFGYLFDAIHASGYRGYLGIEYEGDALPPREGIVKTRALAQRHWPRNPVITPLANERIDSTLKAFVAAGEVAGVSCLVYEKGREVFFGAYGDASRESDRPMARNTIVQIYSMTKPVTGVALMQLYEQGKFALDDPLEKYLPEFADSRVYTGYENGELRTRPAVRPITVRDITRHTAGFYNGGDTPGLQERYAATEVMDRTQPLDSMAARLGRLPLLFDPGSQWNYGPSVDVQALLVQRLSGQPFDVYLREHILDPLGMNETRYVVPQSDRERFASAYLRSAPGVLEALPEEDAHSFNLRPWPLTPGGYGLTSTLDDYQKFARMLLNRGTLDGTTILRPETVRLMRTSHLSDAVTERLWLPSKGQVGFGIDFAVRQRPPADAAENPGTMGEFFWDGAASTLFWVDPANELTAVLFVQLFPFDQIGLHHDFRRAVYGPFRPVE